MSTFVIVSQDMLVLTARKKRVSAGGMDRNEAQSKDEYFNTTTVYLIHVLAPITSYLNVKF